MAKIAIFNRIVVILAGVMLTGCAHCGEGVKAKLPAAGKAKTGKTSEVTARVTYYHRYEDKWGDKVAAPKPLLRPEQRGRAKEGITVAACKKIPFGTKVYIPELSEAFGNDGVFIVQDRGSAINGNDIDVYISADCRRSGNRRIKEMIRSFPDYMRVTRIY